MKKNVLTLFAATLLLLHCKAVFAQNDLEILQFPDPGHVYVPGKDVGFNKYLTKSLKGSKKVVLTFDDGPDDVLTPKLLDVLKSYDVKATFFVLTERINESNYWIINRMVREGHTLASHHSDHGNNNGKTRLQYKAELKDSIKLLAQIKRDEGALKIGDYYRFPYGNYGSSTRDYHHLNIMKEVSKELFGDNCINFVFWDIDTVDWLASMTPADIVQNVVAHVLGGTAFDFKKNASGGYDKIRYTIKNPIGGGVVLMHDVHKKSVDATASLIETLNRNKIQIIDLQDVAEFSYGNQTCHLKN